MVNWSEAPSGRAAHPSGGEEHLLPLHVVLGAAVGDDEGANCLCKHFGLQLMEFDTSNFEFS